MCFDTPPPPLFLVGFRRRGLGGFLSRARQSRGAREKERKTTLPPPLLMRLNEELDVALEVAVVVVVVGDGAEAVGEDPHLHGAVGAA